MNVSREPVEDENDQAGRTRNMRLAGPRLHLGQAYSGDNKTRCRRSQFGVTKEEVEEIFQNQTDADISHSSGLFRLQRPQEAMTMKRITRDRRLTPEEAARYKTIRDQVAQELPELVARHHERMAALDQLDELVKQLKAAREEKGMSLAELTEATGMDRSALSKLETGQRPNPTVETLVRYAEAVGKRLVVFLRDA